MAGIGDTLREARMRQHLDIKDVEEKTKIRAKYLRAMENEDFGVLPGSTFIKSFLRTYAEVLGLDAQLLVEDFRARHEEGAELEYQPITRPDPRVRDRPPRRGPGAGGFVVLALLGLLGFLLVLGITGEGDGEGDEGRSTTATQAGTTTAEERTRRPRRRRAAPRTAVVVVRPEEATYVCVDDGRGKRVFEGTLDGSRRFRGKRLRVNLGRRSAALTANGRRVRVPEGSEPVGYDVTPRGVERIPLRDLPCA